MKLHAAGKTDEAKADLARLKVIREQRAAEAARRQVSLFSFFLAPREGCYCVHACLIQGGTDRALSLTGREGRERREGEGTAGRA
jgi:hypothetical protein